MEYLLLEASENRFPLFNTQHRRHPLLISTNYICLHHDSTSNPHSRKDSQTRPHFPGRRVGIISGRSKLGINRQLSIQISLPSLHHYSLFPRRKSLPRWNTHPHLHTSNQYVRKGKSEFSIQAGICDDYWLAATSHQHQGMASYGARQLRWCVPEPSAMPPSRHQPPLSGKWWGWNVTNDRRRRKTSSIIFFPSHPVSLTLEKLALPRTPTHPHTQSRCLFSARCRQWGGEKTRNPTTVTYLKFHTKHPRREPEGNEIVLLA